MAKIKKDVPLINLIDMGYVCDNTICGELAYKKVYNGIIVIITSNDRQIRCYNNKNLWSPKLYEHCIKDLVLKQYVEE